MADVSHEDLRREVRQASKEINLLRDAMEDAGIMRKA